MGMKEEGNVGRANGRVDLCSPDLLLSSVPNSDIIG